MAIGDNKFKGRFGRGQRDLTGIRVAAAGPSPAMVMIILDRPGRNEAGARPPRIFTGVVGEELTRYLAAGGLTPDDCYITHLVKDYRDGDAPDEWEIIRDEPELTQEIESVFPTIICPAGRAALRLFLPDADIDVVHGIPHSAMHHQLGPVTIIPILPPSSGYFNGDNQQDVLEDFRRLGQFIRGEISVLPDPGFMSVLEPNWINPFHLERECYSTYTHRIALDTEGWLHNPWGLSVCADSNMGLVARTGDNMVSALDLQIEQAVEHDPSFRIYLHNSLHDLPILEGLGVHIPEDRVRDTMVYAYLLQTEPQGLKALAYRLCGMRMKSYEEVVAPYYRAVFEEYVRSAAEIPGLPDYEEEFVLIENGQPKIKRPWGIARHIRKMLKDYDKALAEGRDFDFAERWHNIDDYKKIRVVDLLGEPPEPSLEYVPDDEAIPYSACDAVATRRVGPILEQAIRDGGFSTVSEIDHSVLPMLDRMQRVGMRAVPEYFDALAEECQSKMDDIRGKIHAATGAMINPDSGDQVAALLFDQLHLERKVDFEIRKTDDDERYSTNDKVLEALRFTHPVVGLVCDYREVSKVKNSFCRPLARASRQSKDHRVHPNLRYTRVVSGRLSCVRPNLLAIPVRSELGGRVRGGFVADDGHVLGDWDLDQIEVREMAHQSADPVLLEVFSKGLDPHSMTASLVFGKPYDEIRTDKLLKKTMREPAKRIGFGVITGITAKGLVDQLRLFNATKNGLPMGEGGDPWTEDDCDRLITEYMRVHVGVRNYLDECRAEARRFGYVRDRWGRIRYLPGVYSPIRHIREEALRQSHSHKISASAQGVMKRGMAAIWECIRGWQREGRYAEPLLQVHDEYLGEFADDKDFLSEVDFMIVNCLTTSDTLRVPLGAKGGFGRNWMELK